jgi:hypothetical protein
MIRVDIRRWVLYWHSTEPEEAKGGALSERPVLKPHGVNDGEPMFRLPADDPAMADRDP